ncbi:guanine deaminase [Glaciimonas immobilis]|uniref:Guanine deaminase n=1 Tax=Glaciimonas immobilis TaxID=728004 RepID=A0A840RNS8_9BURK|nr:guanine deaminase [Glaciimonas immobilis]KAF3997149.1 guanine deaminase [Glaciimonas immobilis]MBB5200017.1 guanine deaminase [Glaciimonas immobilis]
MSAGYNTPQSDHTTLDVYRGSVLHFTADPLHHPEGTAWHEDGLLLIRDGHVVAAGDYQHLKDALPDGQSIHDYRGKIIMPGFIDSHVHYPQTDMIASPSPGLLPWLEKYTFPTERKFSDPEHARDVADFFLDQLLSCGTTTAMVYCTVHPESVDAFFAESEARNLRMIAGKVMMDRNCPDFLQDTAEGGIRETEDLLKKWHNRGRQLYAITPRFAPTSSNAQLQLSGELAAAHPDVYLQTHAAENVDEVAWVKSLFPESRSYMDVYDKYGMLRPRSMYGHCVWLNDDDRRRMAETQSAISICPTSNLFLGSGLFDFANADKQHVPLSIATDVGGGTSFSMLQTMNGAYKVARMSGTFLPGLRMFYLATLGGARSMQLENTIGNFVPGAEADFIILDPDATPLLARRTANTDSLEELLFALALLGDDRSIQATFAAGKQVY